MNRKSEPTGRTSAALSRDLVERARAHHETQSAKPVSRRTLAHVKRLQAKLPPEKR